MNYTVERAIEVLSRTPQVLRGMLAGLSTEWTLNNEGPGTWSPVEVVGHLIVNEEENFLLRVKLILNTQEPQILQRMNMTAHVARFSNVSLDEQLTLFEKLRERNITSLKSLSLTTDKLMKTGIHPELGSVTVSQVLSTWVAHDLMHIGQIARVMAKQYKQEIGPFVHFLKRLQ